MGNVAVEVGAHILLFFLVFGMSATVNIGDMRKQLRNRVALLIGLTLQFIILPFVGFCVASFYIAVLLPALIGVVVATLLATKFKLEKPERVAVAVEGCYQVCRMNRS